MREMKNSGIEWVGTIPSNWMVMPNKRIMHKQKVLCDKYNGEDILSLTMNGVIVRNLDAGGKVPATFDGYQIVCPNNLLMCLFDYDVTPRCIGLIKNNGLTSPAYSQFVVDNGNIPSYYYYYYLMIDNTKELLHLAKNLRHSFTEEQLGEIYVPVPPINEQEKIANFLDEKIQEIDNAINKTKETIEDYKKLKQSIITKIVTEGLDDSFKCQKTRLKNVAIIVRGGSPRPIDRFLTDSNDGVNWIKIGDTVKGNKYIDKTSQKIIKEGVKNSRYLIAGDLILTNSMSFGEPYILNINGCIHDGWVAFSQLKGIKKEYLYYFLISDFCKKQFDEQVAGGVVQNLNVEKISKTIIYLPIMQEQIRIVEYLDNKSNEIDKLIAAKEKIVEELESYKKSVIYEYVSGKKEVK